MLEAILGDQAVRALAARARERPARARRAPARRRGAPVLGACSSRVGAAATTRRSGSATPLGRGRRAPGERRLDRGSQALAEAVELADGRLDAGAVERARAVVRRAGERLGLGVEATVVALAGPDRRRQVDALQRARRRASSQPSAGGGRRPRRRPRPSGATPAPALLDWLEVRRRHGARRRRRSTASCCSTCPDFDSVETLGTGSRSTASSSSSTCSSGSSTRRSTPTRCCTTATCARSPRHGDVDGRRAQPGRPAAAGDALAPRAPTSRRLLRGGRARRRAGARRVGADRRRAGRAAGRAREPGRTRARRRSRGWRPTSTTVAAALAAACDGEAPRGSRAPTASGCVGALEEAAGVPTVVRAVGGAHRRRGALATGWPFVRWLRRLRPDPLRRLRLGGRPGARRCARRCRAPSPRSSARRSRRRRGRSPPTRAAGSPARGPPSSARPRPPREDELPDRLDRARRRRRPAAPRRPRWWRARRRAPARCSPSSVLAGALWLARARRCSATSSVDDARAAARRRRASPCRRCCSSAASRPGSCSRCWRGSRTASAPGGAPDARPGRCARRVDEVAEELVLAPVEDELAAYEQLCEQLAAAASYSDSSAARRRPSNSKKRKSANASAV